MAKCKGCPTGKFSTELRPVYFAPNPDSFVGLKNGVIFLLTELKDRYSVKRYDEKHEYTSLAPATQVEHN